MSKKKYITPQIKTLEIESQQILAGSVEPKSTINFATDEDYEEKNKWSASERNRKRPYAPTPSNGGKASKRLRANWRLSAPVTPPAEDFLWETV